VVAAYALDGVTYEIDPTSKNSSKLSDSLAGFVANAPRTGGGAKRSGAVDIAVREASGAGDSSCSDHWR
jgi:hypothetical protein